MKKFDAANYKNPQQEKQWKDARKGIIIFCVIHFLFEIVTGNRTYAIFPVLFNYFVSSEYIKNKIFKEKPIKNLLLLGLSVSGFVFLIRVIIGVIIIYSFK